MTAYETIATLGCIVALGIVGLTMPSRTTTTYKLSCLWLIAVPLATIVIDLVCSNYFDCRGLLDHAIRGL